MLCFLWLLSEYRLERVLRDLIWQTPKTICKQLNVQLHILKGSRWWECSRPSWTRAHEKPQTDLNETGNDKEPRNVGANDHTMCCFLITWLKGTSMLKEKHKKEVGISFKYQYNNNNIEIKIKTDSFITLGVKCLLCRRVLTCRRLCAALLPSHNNDDA